MYKYTAFINANTVLSIFGCGFPKNGYICINNKHMAMTILLGMIGGPQIILIIAVVLLLFGGRKIPELMRGLPETVLKNLKMPQRTRKKTLPKQLTKTLKKGLILFIYKPERTNNRVEFKHIFSLADGWGKSKALNYQPPFIGLI